jgi:hypothetical protein
MPATVAATQSLFILLHSKCEFQQSKMLGRPHLPVNRHDSRMTTDHESPPGLRAEDRAEPGG